MKTINSPGDTSWFQIDLGSSNDDLALHFSPRFEDGHGGAVLVFNSKSGGSWGSEKRELHSQIKRGEEVKIMVKFAGDMFKVELPGGQEVKFPNHAGASFMSYISELYLKKANFTAGDQLILKGLVPPNANRFQIDLGSSNDDLALHFNPRFEDCHGGAVLVLNSMSGGSWGSETRELHSQIKRGEEVKIDLGSSNDDLALHFNPRFEDGHGGAVLVFNSKSGGSWGSEKRELHSQIKRGEEVKIMVKFAGDMFKVELPGGQEVKFPNHAGASFMSYISVSGDLKLTSFKICQ
ncbi:hypothetical protein NHX12_031561 [Muraenolepis orangiensis]|uniref:Galectin n=1 Tax=Muraenolepis orangiensis TaxID=630683 RepID=A0A9Q0IKP3_9TELE|nr:hypothetical protein NHX12_031561 [Muraenolepis orangiensis]